LSGNVSVGALVMFAAVQACAAWWSPGTRRRVRSPGLWRTSKRAAHPFGRPPCRDPGRAGPRSRPHAATCWADTRSCSARRLLCKRAWRIVSSWATRPSPWRRFTRASRRPTPIPAPPRPKSSRPSARMPRVPAGPPASGPPTRRPPTRRRSASPSSAGGLSSPWSTSAW